MIVLFFISIPLFILNDILRIFFKDATKLIFSIEK
jgi:hypothetical protein